MSRPLSLCVLIAGAIALGTALSAAPTNDRLLREFVDDFDVGELPWGPDVPTIETLLLNEWSGKPDLATGRALLKERLGIPDSLTDAVLDAVLLSTRLADEWSEDLNEKQRAEVKRAIDTFEDAAREARDPMPVVRSLLWLHDEWGRALTENEDPLLEWLPESFDPAGIALEIHRGDWIRLEWSAGKESLIIGLASRAGHPALLYPLSRSVDDPSLRVALAELAYRRLDSTTTEVPREARILLGQNWLGTLLDVGMTRRAVQALAALPEPFRRTVLDETAGDVAVEFDGLTVTGSLEDLRLDVSASFALEGDVDSSRKLLRTAIVGLQPPGDDEEADAKQMQIELVERLLQPADSDPFDFFVGVVAAGESHSAHNPIRQVTWRRLFGSLAERERYPALARCQLRRAVNDLNWPANAEELPTDSLGEDLTATRVRAATAVEELRTSLQDGLVEAAPPGGSSSAAALHDAMQRLIDTPRLVLFEEQPLPADVKPVELTEEKQDKRIRRQAAGLNLPDTHEVVRVERLSKEVVVIGVSQDYDPVGELSRGAYWVMRSRDRGISWQRPLYTGIRITQPYVVRSVSDLPLIRNDGLQLEVEIRELDTTRITFPPIGTRAKREQVGLYLDIPWEALERDSDEDGLTDLAEERLITNPMSADTDGDGMDDRHDPLPQVPLEMAVDERTLVLEALLREIGGAETRAIVHEVGNSDSSSEDLDAFLTHAKRASLAGEYTTFIIGEREAFHAIHSDRRIVVLTPEEHSAAREKFGPIFATSIPLLIINRAGDRAFAIWSASWTGGQLAFEKIEGRWVAQTASFWIT